MLAFVPGGGLRATTRRDATMREARSGRNVRSGKWRMEAVAAVGKGKLRLSDMLDTIPPHLRKACLALPPDASIVSSVERRTKIVATIGPSTADPTELLRLAAEGANMVRLNMSHGDYDWHRRVIRSVKKINAESPFVLGTILDVGSLDMVRLGEFATDPQLETGDSFMLTVRHEAEYPEGVSEVSYDGFRDVAEVGDLIQIQGTSGQPVEMIVRELSESDVMCEVTVPGRISSRAPLMIRGKSYSMDRAATLEETDCLIPGGTEGSPSAESLSSCHPLSDITFAIEERVDYVSLSFVESSEPIIACRQMLREHNSNILIIAKIESQPALENLEDICGAADAVMIARGDLGTAIPFEQVPTVQEKIVKLCRSLGKPCLISTHFLESMTMYPTPTRAEVADITEAVYQSADALILTSETASGRYPFKALATMHAVMKRIEEHVALGKARKRLGEMSPSFSVGTSLASHQASTSLTNRPSFVAEKIAATAAILANQRDAKAILVFTQKGLMANLVSRNRPRAPVVAFTAAPAIRNKLSVLYGVRPLQMSFYDDSEQTIREALDSLKSRAVVSPGDLVIVVADVLGGSRGASDEETDAVFAEFSRGSGFIPRGRVRAALRRLGLKASDAVEVALGMRDLDSEESVRIEQAASSVARGTVEERIDFENFKHFVSEATEVVHTVQMRTID